MNSKKALFSLLISAVLLFTCLGFCSCGETPEDNAYEAQNAVVRVLRKDDGSVATGSGFAVGVPGQESDIFVTNRHVVMKSDNTVSDEVYIMLSNDSLVIENYYITLTADEAAQANDYVGQEAFKEGDLLQCDAKMNIDNSTLVKCKVLKTSDEYPDLAIIQAEKTISGITALPLGNAEDLKKGQTVFALGYPGSADETQASIETRVVNGREMTVMTEVWSASLDEMSLTRGTVNKLTTFKSFGDTSVIVHSSHINHGNSGGPLIDENGCVVGINTYGSVEDPAFQYSLYVEYAESFLDDLGIHWEGEKKSSTAAVIAVCAVIIIIIAAVAAIAVLKGRKQPIEKAKLTCVSGELKGLSTPITSSPLLIGRADGCGVQFAGDAKGVSRIHCRLQWKNGCVTVTDLNSSYGTFVNGKRLEPDVETALNKGDKIQIADDSREFIIN